MSENRPGTFTQGDPRINRKGRLPNADKEMLRKALEAEGVKRGVNFWEKVAQVAFNDKSIMAVVAKKFVPDMNTTEHSGEVHVTEMPTVQRGGEDLEIDIGSDPEPPSNSGPTPEVAPVPDGDQPVSPVSS